ncbi:hypothetical protein FACS1894199_11250 [Bacteroidia bacterium]|nr:hypothetical protein FACS1894199_11250 [Bacteroidia bacterium]
MNTFNFNVMRTDSMERNALFEQTVRADVLLGIIDIPTQLLGQDVTISIASKRPLRRFSDLPLYKVSRSSLEVLEELREDRQVSLVFPRDSNIFARLMLFT